MEEINRQLDIAGFPGPSATLRPDVHFDPDLGDVEIFLPKPMMKDFLAQADALEQRMAEKMIISIEAVRLTDRDIVDGALATRLTAQVQGVHDVERFRTTGVLRQLGVNSLLAIANQQLQVRTLRAVEQGQFPSGVVPIAIERPELPPLQITPTATTVGSTFSVGSDDIFFDGREQSYGFSYVGPDGIEHRLSLDVVDSLREFWTRIERNLIVHKIKKVPTLTDFRVPVGPSKQTYEGLAALISQEDQQLIVATGTGAISEIDATAGTWLIINDFDISPIPGSSTVMTEEELARLGGEVLLTMWLRDPATPIAFKQQILAAESWEQLGQLAREHFEENRQVPTREGRSARTYGQVYEERYGEVVENATIEKKEANSVISVTFYSNQGNIIQTPGTTQLGSANDLTSFTTELVPNQVTPISSFITKGLDSARGTSPLTGTRKGESKDEEKTMTHLLIRARFPTAEREQRDLDEGKHLGYFRLPIRKEPLSVVDVPFLSSSDHPLERLASFGVGILFDVLDPQRVRNPWDLFNTNILEGTVTPDVWKLATTRMLMNRKIISDSTGVSTGLAPQFRQRFVIEVRSLLEYDADFFPEPNLALRNMVQWNNPDRILVALNNSPGRFALERLLDILDDLGARLVPDDYADEHLAVSPNRLLGGHQIGYLSQSELRVLRRDAAAHYLRLEEAYGDAFLEAVSNLLGLGTYRATKKSDLVAGPFHGYEELVIFDRSGRALADGEDFTNTHERFMLLKQGGYKGALFAPSLLTIEDLRPQERRFVIRGTELVGRLSR